MILELNEMIGILTFIGTQSHGACLQAYALKEKITEIKTRKDVIKPEDEVTIEEEDK